MIEVRMWPEEGTRTPGKSCYYLAEATIDGVVYRGRSRMGASNELARVLLAAGIPDAPMQVEQVGLAGYLTWKSFHNAPSPARAAALWTYEETATTPLHRVPYARVEANRERFRARRGGVQGEKQWETGEAPIPVPDELSDA